MPVRWPLVGRGDEVRLLTHAIRRSGDSRGAVLVGEAGVGKTRLAQEVFEQSRRDGVVARWVTATTSARAVPLGAFALVLPSVGSDPLRALDQAVAALLAGAGRGGVLIVVDDAHLLDDVSALLVHQLVLSGLATVVATVRVGEAVPDAVTALWKDGHLDRVPVRALSSAETGRLLEAVLGGPVDAASAAGMWRLAGGNPLYLRELLGGERTAGRWALRDGTWHRSDRLALSAELVELVETRMGALAEPVRAVVDVLALAGVLPLSVLAGLVDHAAVEAAEDAGLVAAETTTAQPVVRLAHPLYGEVRLARVGVLRARRLRGRIARALVAAGDVADELRCATLFLDSDLNPEPALLLRAATRSAELLDLPLAVRLARAGVAAGGGFTTQGILVEGLSLLGQGEQATEEMARLTELASTDQEVAWATTVRAGNLFWTLNDPDQAEAVLTAVSRRLTDDTARHMLLAMRATFAAHQGRPEQALCDADAVFSSGTDLAPNTVLFASWGRTIALGVTGRPGTAAAATGYAATGRYDTAMMRFLLADAELTGLLLAGHLTEAEAVTARCRADAADLPGVPLLMATALTSQLHLALGRVRHAAEGLRRALFGFATTDPGGRVFDCWLWLARALAMTGDTTGARDAVAELDRHHHPAFGFRLPDVYLSRAWVAAAHGALSEAITLAHHAGQHAREHGMPAVEAAALHTAVRFGDRTAADRLAAVAERLSGPRAPAAAAHAAAHAADDGAALRTVSATFERMGDLLTAADAAAQASVAWHRRGRPRTAHADAARAHQLARRCQGARTPAIVAAARPLPITSREREIITLAGNGLSNRDIADRLGVSVRTVEGHLYRAGVKLGVTHRTHLARLLHEP